MPTTNDPMTPGAKAVEDVATAMDTTCTIADKETLPIATPMPVEPAGPAPGSEEEFAQIREDRKRKWDEIREMDKNMMGHPVAKKSRATHVGEIFTLPLKLDKMSELDVRRRLHLANAEVTLHRHSNYYVSSRYSEPESSSVVHLRNHIDMTIELPKIVIHWGEGYDVRGQRLDPERQFLFVHRVGQPIEESVSMSRSAMLSLSEHNAVLKKLGITDAEMSSFDFSLFINCLTSVNTALFEPKCFDVIWKDCPRGCVMEVESPGCKYNKTLKDAEKNQ
jgi:hypothetical protein